MVWPRRSRHPGRTAGRKPRSKKCWYGPRSTRRTRRPTCPLGGRVLHVMIICYHADLKKVFYFEFWDKLDTFVESSAKFNSVRFLT